MRQHYPVQHHNRRGCNHHSEQRRAFHNHNNTQQADTRLLVSSGLTSSTSHLTQRVGKINIAIASCCSPSLFLLKFLVTRLQAVIDCSLSVYYIYLGAAGGCFCAVLAKLLAAVTARATQLPASLLSPVPSSPVPGSGTQHSYNHNMPTHILMQEYDIWHYLSAAAELMCAIIQCHFYNATEGQGL